MGVLSMLVAVSLLGACGRSKTELTTSLPDAAALPETPTPPVGATPDASAPSVVTLESCIDRPPGLPTPPVGQLPCELIPPGLSLSSTESGGVGL